MSKTKQLLFSITKKDFEVQTFRSGGKGGQHQNKTESGVRIIHKDSGAIGESREERSQAQNKKNAFNRLVNSKKFQQWIRIQAAKASGLLDDIEEVVDRQMDEKNIKTEVKEDGKWVQIDEKISI